MKGSLFATVHESWLFTPFSVAAGACRRKRISGLNHLVLVLGLSRLVSFHSCIAQLLNKLRPVRIVHRNGHAIRASSSRDQEQIGGLRQSQCRVFYCLPTSEGAGQGIGRHGGVLAGDILHVRWILALREENHVRCRIQDATHQLVQVGLNLHRRGCRFGRCRAFRSRLRWQT